MIHVFDESFQHLNEEAFDEAYMTHTSTSPNYQILARWTSAAPRPSWRATSWCSGRRSWR
jgi:arginine/lysine/ornithine decarboxylase